MPLAAERICNKCRKRSSNCGCEKTSSNWNRYSKGKTTERGYGHAWRKLRLSILRRDQYLCQQCLQDGRLTSVTGKGEAHVDHKLSKERGGTDDADNLWTLCVPCHQQKTSRIDSKVGGGQN